MPVPVVQLLDYELRKGTNLKRGRSGKLNYLNQMCFNLYWQMEVRSAQDQVVRSLRLKFYFSINAKLNDADGFDKANTALDEKIKAIISDMKL